MLIRVRLVDTFHSSISVLSYYAMTIIHQYRIPNIITTDPTGYVSSDTAQVESTQVRLCLNHSILRSQEHL